MNRVAAKVAKKIGVLLQNDDLHTRAGKEMARHHSSRPAAHDAASGVGRLQGCTLHRPLSHSAQAQTVARLV